MVTMLKNKCSVGRELNFLHSDITLIILHGQILILYNWRRYLSINPRTMHHVAPGSNSTTQSNFGTSRIPRYCCSGHHRFVSTFHNWKQTLQASLGVLQTQIRPEVGNDLKTYTTDHDSCFHASDVQVLWSYTPFFGLLALFTIITSVAIADLQGCYIDYVLLSPVLQQFYEF